jgi:hypothetical protein
MAPLQKRALFSLLIGLTLAIALIAVFVTRDINTFDTDLGFRLIVYALWISVPIAYLIVMKVSPLKKLRQIDERDRLIMERAPQIQWLAVIISLAVWIVVLTESYWDQGQVPVIFLTLIMISTLVISTLAESFGILIGYWKMR